MLVRFDGLQPAKPKVVTVRVTSPSQQPVDPVTFRTALGHYASGLTIVSGLHAQGPVGFTCQSFYSVSIAPPLVSFSVMRDSTTYPPMRATGRLAVNILAHDQRGLANQFARKGTDKWANVEWTETPAGSPMIQGALLCLDCEVHAEHEAGDHVVVIARVIGLQSAAVQYPSPLLYFRGQYAHLRYLDGEHP
jgi:3-hydroxy-9,10-secoandrosta-1,3,5(10)-triene-9,17-dione monooxygenase reductase component